MWQFLFGFGAGVYVGTYFECKPAVEKIIVLVKSSIPEKKNETFEKIKKDENFTNATTAATEKSTWW